MEPKKRHSFFNVTYIFLKQKTHEEIKKTYPLQKGHSKYTA